MKPDRNRIEFRSILDRNRQLVGELAGIRLMAPSERMKLVSFLLLVGRVRLVIEAVFFVFLSDQLAGIRLMEASE